VVDAQVHLDRIGGMGAGLAAMNALGVDLMVVDEVWSYADGRRQPSYRLPGGVLRHEYPMAAEATHRHPDRFAHTVWIDHRDSNLDAILTLTREHPYQCAIRLPIGAAMIPQLLDGELDQLLAGAGYHQIPVMVSAPKNPQQTMDQVLTRVLRGFPGTTFILDHCGVFPLSDEDFENGVGAPELLERSLRYADYDNALIKWSWAPTVSEREFPYEDVQKYLRRYADVYGAERIMWASDVSQVGFHHTWNDALLHVVLSEALSSREKTLMLGETAISVLGLPAGRSARDESSSFQKLVEGAGIVP
jgi:predicted TIM-barrel fold metal-dependent hydrolase